MSPKDLRAIANFIYEVGMLSRTPRSGLWFLGSGNQSVAEHLLRAVYIGYSLAHFVPAIDTTRVVLLCLFHDLGEGRTSDLSYVHQKYGRLAEAEAIQDISKTVPFGAHIKKLYTEIKEQKTIEAKLAKDADQLEWLATMREEAIKGNKKADAWAKITYKRLKTPIGKKIGKFLLTTNPDEWFFNSKDKWFINRDPRFRSWRA